ncbi:hypothetical protein [Pseudovibrio flavus]|uniref:hypothetical protein n=1 Tax=Pseudovibrio flavus TaxID=2529854 RepID=UPI0012BC2E52|nr:hypothetical protein [Pseudovibrio flavus]
MLSASFASAGGLRALTAPENSMTELKPRSSLRELSVREELKPFENEKLELRRFLPPSKFKGMVPFIPLQKSLRTFDI